VGRAVGEVEDAVRGTDRGAVRRNITEPHRNEGRGPVNGELQFDRGRTQDLEALGEWSGVEGQ
jgi:hypothetical protein